jgi:hypothetical protein
MRAAGHWRFSSGELTVNRQRWSSRALLRLPVLLFVLFICGLLVTALPAATGDSTADAVLGQIDFTRSAPNFVDNKGLSLNSEIGAVTADAT